MIRGGNVIAGTSTTGPGTLTLASVSVGASDYFQFLSGGYSFAAGTSIILPYDIIEYTSSSYATPLQRESGFGTLNLGASLAATTMNRTTIVETMGSTGTFVNTAPSAISIGTAANTLVFIGISDQSVPAVQPYTETSLNDGISAPYLQNPGNLSAGAGLTNGSEYYIPFLNTRGIYARRIYVRVSSGYTGTTNLFGRLYQVGSVGRPSKLLLDFGVLGTANSSLATVTLINSALASPGIYLPPGGEYFVSLYSTFTGGTGSPTLTSVNTNMISSSILGLTNMNTINITSSASTATNPAPDPANLTGYATSTTLTRYYAFAFGTT